MMTRTFLPVGQGACYLEQFRCGGSRFTIMYDCGSITPLGQIDNLLPQYLPKGTHVDALFISHFDNDHVNGLPFVLQEYKVRNLFLPLITEDECSLLRLYFTVFSSSQKEKAVFDQLLTGSYQRNDLSVFYVRPRRYENENAFIRDGDLQTVSSGENVSGRIFRQAVPQEAPCSWEFVPFNFQQQNRIGALREELFRLFGQNLSLQEVMDSVKRNKDYVANIKEAYKSISGNLNENSLVLFSGSVDETLRQRYECPCLGANDCPVFPFSTPSGCLYMGDYNAKGTAQWNELDRAFKQYWNRIGCLQIPHHGSKHNYNKKLTNNYPCYYVISAGMHNRYRHPNKEVISNMLSKKAYPFWVNENPTTTVVLTVW